MPKIHSIGHSLTEENRALVTQMIDDVLIQGNGDSIANYISTETYIQHNPSVADGLEGLRTGNASNHLRILKRISEHSTIISQIERSNMTQTVKKMSSNQLKLYIDIFLLVSFVIVNIPQATGIPFHEWVSVLFIVPLLVHILIDWKWIVSVTKRMFGRLPGEVRFNHIFDLVIFIMMTLALMTGFVISEAALPAIGIHIAIDPFWSMMHDLTANLTMVLIGVHLAMHWGWIASSFKRYFGRKATPSTTTTEGAN